MSKVEPSPHRFHGGPLRGKDIHPDDLPASAAATGLWACVDWHGVYKRDEGSAGGRDWDWEPT